MKEYITSEIIRRSRFAATLFSPIAKDSANSVIKDNWGKLAYLAKKSSELERVEISAIDTAKLLKKLEEADQARVFSAYS